MILTPYIFFKRIPRHTFEKGIGKFGWEFSIL